MYRWYQTYGPLVPSTESARADFLSGCTAWQSRNQTCRGQRRWPWPNAVRPYEVREYECQKYNKPRVCMQRYPSAEKDYCRLFAWR